MLRLSMIGGLLVMAAAAAAETPSSSERPKPRPLTVVAMSASQAIPGTAEPRPAMRPAAAAGPAGPAAGASLAAGLLAAPAKIPAASERRPEARPSDEEIVLAAAVQTQPGGAAITGRKGAVCGDPALVGTSVPAIRGKVKGCGMSDGAKVTAIDGVRLSREITVDCPTALALRAWVSDGLKASVGNRGGGVAEIEIMGSYECRPVNNRPGNRISEHGRGKAVDIGGVTLKDGEVIRVLWHWGKGAQGKILQAMQWTACQSFGTVLSPAANRFHRDHFHFDTARRKSTYCR